MHNLVHLYAAKKVLTRPEKERKIQLCVIVLETLVKIDPGYTKWRGTLLQEMIHSVMVSFVSLIPFLVFGFWSLLATKL